MCTVDSLGLTEVGIQNIKVADGYEHVCSQGHLIGNDAAML